MARRDRGLGSSHGTHDISGGVGTTQRERPRRGTEKNTKRIAERASLLGPRVHILPSLKQRRDGFPLVEELPTGRERLEGGTKL